MKPVFDSSLRALICGLTISFAVFSPAMASDWVPVKGAKIRLIAAHVDGQDYAALHIKLEPGWHTYWRYPGASGIAPDIEPTDSVGVDLGETLYPAPFFYDDGVGGFIGYQGDTGFVLPLHIDRPAGADAPVLQLALRLGMCRTICVPVETSLTAPLSDADLGDSEAAHIIATLLAKVPPSSSPHMQVQGLVYDDGYLRLSFRGGPFTAPDMVLVPEAGEVIEPLGLVEGDGDRYIFQFRAVSALDPPFFKRKLRLLARQGDVVIEQTIGVQTTP
jgi:DsbC/DsbD-like thiol-disulfide interchange protein